MDGRIADGVALREHQRRHRDGVGEGAGREQAGQRVGQRIADVNIVRAAGRADLDRRIGHAAAELVLAVGADAEQRGVAIGAHLAAGLEGVLAANPGEVLAHLEQVAVGPPSRIRRVVEGFVEAVAELQRGVGAVSVGNDGVARVKLTDDSEMKCGDGVRVR
jgi:hypothetical protein